MTQPQQMRFEYRWLMLGVDIVHNQLRGCWQNDVRQTSMREGVQAWSKDRTGMKALVWDRAPAHRTKAVREAMAKAGCAVIFQPPYAPELNPAERVFEHIRALIAGEVYASLEDKIACVEQVLQELNADTDALRRMVAWEWIKDNLAALTTN